VYSIEVPSLMLFFFGGEGGVLGLVGGLKRVRRGFIYFDEMVKDWFKVFELAVVEGVEALGALLRGTCTAWINNLFMSLVSR